MKDFWSKPVLDIKTGCLNWPSRINRDGYGFLRYKGKATGAHRMAYILYSGKDIPVGMCVCHSCDNRRCVNPEHLFLGSVKDNVQDMINKGRDRGITKINRYKTECKNGHSLDKSNLTGKKTERECRQCRNNRTREYKKRIKCGN